MSVPTARRDGRRDCGFVGIPTFMRSPLCEDLDLLDAAWGVLGVPYDEGSPFAPGTRFGPRGVREQSLRFRASGVFESGSRTALLGGGAGLLADVGDVDVLPSNPATTLARVTEAVRGIRARGARPLVVGGDHSVSFPVVRAFDETLHVIQLDAHLDYMPVSEELPHTNGQGFRKIHALDHVRSLTQIGIRGLRNGAADFADAEAAGSRIVHLAQLRDEGPERVLAHIPSGASCYVSIDIDAYDLPLVPGCVSGEPDGFGFGELVATLGAIAARFDVRGFDLVEVNPMLDVGTNATSYLAAMTIVQFLGLIEAARR